MQSQRNLLLIAWLFISFMMWQNWVAFKNPPVKVPETALINKVPSPQGETVTIKTDVLSLKINTSGGDIEHADLLKFDKSLHSKTPFTLLEHQADFTYIAQSGLAGRDGPDSANQAQRPLYASSKTHYELNENKDTLVIPLMYVSPEAVIYKKIYTLKRGSYVVDVRYEVRNNSNQPLELAMFGQLRQSVDLPKSGLTTNNNFATHTYRGAAYSTDNNKYQKYSFSKIESSPLKEQTTGGWIAMLQQYFATAWIPNQQQPVSFQTQYQPEQNIASIAFRGETVTVAPHSEQTFDAKLWVGPEEQKTMAQLAPNLDLTVDYGWLWFLSQPLFKLLTFIHHFVNNWGLSIILITFIVRGIMYPLTKAQYTSMAKMKLLQPKLQAMRERFGDDRQRMSQEMMALYKAEKVNPLGGCFPLIIQMPIFISLYYMLMGSVELRHAPFFGWLQDLSAQDPYYILPILMGGTMLLIQKMSPTPVADPLQEKIMLFMPVIFTVFFLWFPSGLVLYYTVSNLVTIVQQQLIYRGLEKRGLHTRVKKKP